MSSLYPFRFKPILKEKLWGGTRMNTILAHSIGAMKQCGESWEISGLIGDESEITNGFLAENNLNELLEIYLTDLVGEENYERFGLGFPLLIKFIDAHDDLSVQVHPDDELAQREYGQNGKSEMWHVIDAEPGSGLYVGFNKKVAREQFENAVESGTLADCLRFYPVRPGDTFMIPAGTVHAIGKGVLLAEIQQPSDITFRIYDWDRVDDDGNPRELHIPEAMEAIHWKENMGDFKIDYQLEKNEVVKLNHTPYFNVNILNLDKPMNRQLVKLDTFVIYMCLEGKTELIYDEGRELMQKGDVLLVPADMDDVRFIPSSNAKLLEIYC